MPQRHRQVLRKILSCRTPALGGELFQCPDCPAFDYLARYVFKSATVIYTHLTSLCQTQHQQRLDEFMSNL